MSYYIKNTTTLTKILWTDFAMGSSCGIVGLLFSDFFATLFGLSSGIILWISAITTLYSIVALRVVVIKPISIPLLRFLIIANWAWTLVSVVIIFFHIREATILGMAFLILQIIIVGGLAWLEGNQLAKK